MERVTFIHAADLHIDSPFIGLSHIHEDLYHYVRTSTFKAFDRMIDYAIKQRVDFILLVGDLFDHEKQSLHAQVHLRTRFEQLLTYDIHVYISYGNHDFLQGNVHDVKYPENVHIFSSEEVTSKTFIKNGHPLVEISGFSYESRAVLTNKTSEYVITNDDIPYHIAMLHGSIQTNTEHDRYAPFQLTDLLKQPYDYWALGHIHKRDILHKDVPVIYPGNTQGRHRKETGVKGCYHVTLEGDHCETQFIETSVLTFETLRVKLKEISSIYDIEEQLVHELTTTFDSEQYELIHLQFETAEVEHFKWEEDGTINDLIDIINDNFTKKNVYVFIVSHDLEIVKPPTINFAQEDFLRTLNNE